MSMLLFFTSENPPQDSTSIELPCSANNQDLKHGALFDAEVNNILLADYPCPTLLGKHMERQHMLKKRFQ